MYPPGYPALLALLGITGASDLPLALVLSIALSVSMLALTALLASRASPWLGVALLLVGATNPALVNLASRVQTEPAFGALLAAMLVFAAASGDGARRSTLAAACAIAAALTRSIGVALVVALLLDWVLQRRWRMVLLFGAASALTVGAWLVWTVRAPRLDAGSSYIADALYAPSASAAAAASPAEPAEPTEPTSEPTEPTEEPTAASPAPASFASVIASRVRSNVPGYLLHSLPAAMGQPTVPGTPIDNAAWLVLTLAAGTIGFFYWASHQRLVVLSVVMYAGILVVWPYEAERFLAPILPLLMLGLLTGVWWAGRRWASARVAWVSVWTLAAVLAASGISLHLARRAEIAGCDRDGAPRRSLGCIGPKKRDFFAAVEVANDSAAAGESFLASKAATVYVFTGRQSLQHAEAMRTRDPDAFMALLRTSGVGMVLLTHVHIQQWAFAPMLQARCAEFALVQALESQAAVLRLLPPDAPARDSTQSAVACDAIRRWAGIDWMREVGGLQVGPW
jgi:hypothetical protein